VYNLITGPGGSIGDALVRNPKVDKIAFTGSTAVGKKIARNGAETLKHATMELGGKAPNIIFADANLDAAVETAFWAIFWNKGEVCVAGSRLIVEEQFTMPWLRSLLPKPKPRFSAILSILARRSAP
jgi:aldehyde dehydrogenase (NAD+)